jgi:mRNA interferase MazF
MRDAAYKPAQGDLVWLDFSPQSGHEQAGRRPALVISPRAYNDKVGFALFCPVTSQIKGYPFEVPIPVQPKIKGAVLADQLKSLDWKARHAEFITRLPAASLQEILGKIAALTKYSHD